MPEGDEICGVDNGQPVEAEPPARARLRPTVELAERFAEEMRRPHSHQLGACARLRLPYATYKRWLAWDPEEHPMFPELSEFQGIVLSAVDEQRSLDAESIDDDLSRLHGPDVAKASALVNKHTFHHQNRFKRFYANDDEPKKTEIELGNKDGKPFKSASAGLTEATRRALLSSILGVPEPMIDAGAQLGEPGEDK